MGPASLAAIAGSACSQTGNRHGSMALPVQNKAFDGAMFCADTLNNPPTRIVLRPLVGVKAMCRPRLRYFGKPTRRRRLPSFSAFL